MHPLREKIIQLQEEEEDDADDSVDLKEKTSILELLWRVRGIIIWFFFLVIDVMRILNYFSGVHYLYFGLSVAIFIFSGIVSGSYLALTLNLRPRTAKSIFDPTHFSDHPWHHAITKPLLIVLKYICLMLFGAVMRRMEALYFAYRRNKASDEKDKEDYLKYHRKLKESDFESRITDLVACICKHIPQMILSLHFIFQNTDNAEIRNQVVDDPFMLFTLAKLSVLMVVNVGFSVDQYVMHSAWQVTMVLKDALQIAYILFSHHVNVFYNDQKANKIWAGIVYFTWRLVEVTSRVQILIVLVIFNQNSITGILVHFAIFALLLRFFSLETGYRNVIRLEVHLLRFRYICSFAISCITLFIPFMLPSRKKYFVYYSTILIENTALLLTAFFTQFFSWPTILTLYITYFTGLALMLFYLCFFMKFANKDYIREKNDWVDLNRHILQMNSKIGEELCKCTLREMEQTTQSEVASFSNFIENIKKGVDKANAVLKNIEDADDQEAKEETIKTVTDVVGELKNVMQHSSNSFQKEHQSNQSDADLVEKVWKKMHELVKEMHEELISLNRSSDSEAAVNFNMDHIQKMEEEVDSFLRTFETISEKVVEMTKEIQDLLNNMGETIDSCENVLTREHLDLLKNVRASVKVNVQSASRLFAEVLEKDQNDVGKFRVALKCQERGKGTNGPINQVYHQ